MSDLESTLDKLLAAEFGVTPDKVNAKVECWHDEHHFPIEQYETESIYGGYDSHRLNLPTDLELKEMSERADAFLDQYSEIAST